MTPLPPAPALTPERDVIEGSIRLSVTEYDKVSAPPSPTPQP